MAPGEASHRWQFYGAEGTFALLEKDDLDYGVIGNPTKATKEKGDKLVEAVVEGYSELIKELLETHPVGKNPLGLPQSPGLQRLQRRRLSHLRQGPRREGADPPTTRSKCAGFSGSTAGGRDSHRLSRLGQRLRTIIDN